jgi:hypothetical protein
MCRNQHRIMRYNIPKLSPQIIIDRTNKKILLKGGGYAEGVSGTEFTMTIKIYSLNNPNTLIESYIEPHIPTSIIVESEAVAKIKY